MKVIFGIDIPGNCPCLPLILPFHHSFSLAVRWVISTGWTVYEIFKEIYNYFF